MAKTDPRLSMRSIRAALARDRYHRNEVRLADPDVSGYAWLVASHRGLFAVSPKGQKVVLHGWFFGICRSGAKFYMFENCGSRDPEDLGRIISFELRNGRLEAPAVLATGLHNNCHQIRIIDERLCLLDTANQAIVRFECDGFPVDIRRPFPPAPADNCRGDYLHINSIAKIGDRIAIMLHNGKARPEKPSEIAWLDGDWQVEAREQLAGHCCHDIVEDESGTIWHCASMSGEIAGSDGTRVKVTDALMTRGLAIAQDSIIVGTSTFGPRHLRDGLNGGVVIFGRNFSRKREISLGAGPTDIVAL
jgi:hypothetical protein